eukprot:12150506-Ditylum_brightwellii.AAC.1
MKKDYDVTLPIEHLAEQIKTAVMVAGNANQPYTAAQGYTKMLARNGGISLHGICGQPGRAHINRDGLWCKCCTPATRPHRSAGTSGQRYSIGSSSINKFNASKPHASQTT